MDEATTEPPSGTWAEQMDVELREIFAAVAADIDTDPLDVDVNRLVEMDSLAVLETTLAIEARTGVELDLDDARRCGTLRDLVAFAISKRALNGLSE